jgi:hypothetical protein
MGRWTSAHVDAYRRKGAQPLENPDPIGHCSGVEKKGPRAARMAQADEMHRQSSSIESVGLAGTRWRLECV